MCRYRHDGSGTVGHQYIVSDPYRDAFFVDRVDRITAGEDTCFFLVDCLAFDVGLARRLADIIAHGTVLLRCS